MQVVHTLAYLKYNEISVSVKTVVQELVGVLSPAPATNNECLESVGCNCYHVDILVVCMCE